MTSAASSASRDSISWMMARLARSGGVASSGVASSACFVMGGPSAASTAFAASTASATLSGGAGAPPENLAAARAALGRLRCSFSICSTSFAISSLELPHRWKAMPRCTSTASGRPVRPLLGSESSGKASEGRRGLGAAAGAVLPPDVARLVALDRAPKELLRLATARGPKLSMERPETVRFASSWASMRTSTLRSSKSALKSTRMSAPQQLSKAPRAMPVSAAIITASEKRNLCEVEEAVRTSRRWSKVRVGIWRPGGGGTRGGCGLCGAADHL